MKKNLRFGLLAAVLIVSASSFAAEAGHSGHSDASGHKSGLGRPLPPGWEPAIHDPMFRTFTLIDRVEFRAGDTEDAAIFDAEGWIGGDYNRLWWKAEVE